METAECGAACLGMILAYYGRYEPLETLRTACGVSRNGSRASFLLHAAREYGLEANGYKRPAGALDEVPRPAVLFWDFNHFVVFEGRKGDFHYINDPAQGPVCLRKEDFIKHYTGVVFCFSPTPDFMPGGERRGVAAALFPLLFRVRSVTAAVTWAGLLLVVPGLLLPGLLRIFIDEVLTFKEEWLYPLIVAAALTASVQALLNRLSLIAMRRGEIRLAADTTLNMLAHLFSLPLAFFTQRSTAMLQQGVAMNKSIASAVFEHLALNAVNCLTSVFFLLLLYRYSPVLTGLTVVIVILNIAALRCVNERRQVLNQSLVSADTRYAGLTLNGIAMMEDLRAAGRDDFFFNEWSSSLAEYMGKRQAMQYSGILFSLLPDILFGINSAVILCFGAWRIIEGDMTLGTLMAFTSLTAAFTAPVNALVSAGATLQELKGAVDRVNDILRYPVEERFSVARSAEEDRLPAARSLELEAVTFGYSRLEKPLIRDFSLKLPPGSRIALVGSSGSGKSTIAKLAAGLYQPWSGRLLLDGEPAESKSKEYFNRSVAAVDQNILLFSGSVGDNLTLYHRSPDNRRLHAALEDACISEDLARRGGAAELDLHVEERGNNFSGGQRQRLEVARAFARETPILILDEATSAMDAVTEQQVYAFLRKRGATCLIVAHRLSAVRDCDEIIVLDKGSILERGKHDVLMALNGEYARLMRSM
jgi:NHLM bacteriocin system ABC transporter peptidase/ATP-binding protein